MHCPAFSSTTHLEPDHAKLIHASKQLHMQEVPLKTNDSCINDIIAVYRSWTVRIFCSTRDNLNKQLPLCIKWKRTGLYFWHLNWCEHQKLWGLRWIWFLLQVTLGFHRHDRGRNVGILALFFRVMDAGILKSSWRRNPRENHQWTVYLQNGNSYCPSGVPT